MLKFTRKGVILLDKPESMTSMQCVEKVKEILGAQKAGHSGTLDPKVTGVMLIAINDATKAMPFFIGLEKEYEGVMHLHDDVQKSDIRRMAGEFRGRITQIPPVRSAVARKPRERDIYSFQILGIQGRDVSFRVSCQSGTYIRKLCHDFGERLGPGAHMTRLRRTRIDRITAEECLTVEQVSKKKARAVMPLENILERTGLKKVSIRKGALVKIRNGMPVIKDYVIRMQRAENEEHIGIYQGRSIVALGVVKDSKAPLIKTDRVFK